jgi:CheY-like chemotaxis protein
MADALPRILCVDDEPNVLAGMQRSLGDVYAVTVAGGGELALKLLASSEPFVAVISDMRMPAMDGATFLSQARERWPRMVRILLTGQSDLPSAIAAVNKGAIFRFLSKPCGREKLLETLQLACALHDTEQAERRLLETTLTASVNTLAEILSIADPAAFRRANFARAATRHAMRKLKWEDGWQYEVAATLCEIGSVGRAGGELAAGERAQLGHRLIAAIPRLEIAAEIVRYQNTAPPLEAAAPVLRGSALLRAVLALEELTAQNTPADRVSAALRKVEPPIEPELLAALSGFRADYSQERAAMISELRAGWVLDQDIQTQAGLLVLSRNHELTDAAISALRRLHKGGAIEEPVRVRFVATAAD